MLTEAPNHVVTVWNHGDGASLRVYDNDSYARTQGTYTLLNTNVAWRGKAVAIVREGSPLQREAEVHIPPRRVRGAAPEAPPGDRVGIARQEKRRSQIGQSTTTL